MSYIANKHNMANITNIHYYDSVAGAWGPNLLGMALPYGLLPAAPAVGDVVVFGIDTAMLDSGPFCSLVFDLSTAQNDLTITWRYSDVGILPTAWGALTVQDNTDADGAMTGQAFDTTGRKSVHWEQPAAWVDTLDPTIGGNALGVIGYWVCAHVTAIGVGPSAPVQQTNHPYTITWPFVEVNDEYVLGDVPSLLQIAAHNRSGGHGVPAATNRLVVGLRSKSRGENFTAYLNLSDEQNPAEVSISPSIDVIFANDVTTPSGRRMTYAPGADRTMREAVSILIGPPLQREYYGRYHTFLRAQQSGGNAGDIGARIQVEAVGAGSYHYGRTEYTQITGVWETLDLGDIVIPSNPVRIDENIYVYLKIQLSNSNGVAASLYLYDLILIPIDEWAVDCQDYLTSVSTSALETGYDYQIEMDSVYIPRVTIRSFVRYVDDPLLGEQIVGPYRAIAGGPAIVQANADQRLWFFAENVNAPTYWPRDPGIEIVHTIQMSHVSRYFSMRGSR